MTRVVAVCLAIMVLGLPTAAQVKLLIIDETETVEESLRVEALARGLRASGAFQTRAVLRWPTERWEGEPFHLVLYLPREGPRAWLCSPGPAEYLPEGLRQAYDGLAQGVAQAFDGQRKAVGMSDDLFAWILSLRLAQLGYFAEGGR